MKILVRTALYLIAFPLGMFLLIQCSPSAENGQSVRSENKYIYTFYPTPIADAINRYSDFQYRLKIPEVEKQLIFRPTHINQISNKELQVIFEIKLPEKLSQKGLDFDVQYFLDKKLQKSTPDTK